MYQQGNLININMRCIEINLNEAEEAELYLININMRCIEIKER